MPHTEPGYPFRAVGSFLSDVLAARALDCALKIGLIDLLSRGPVSTGLVGERYDLVPRGEEFFSGLLLRSGVLMRSGDSLALTPEFRAVLAYRDLIEAKLQFAEIVLPDFLNLFLPFVQNGGAFMADANVFELFRYDRAAERSMENRIATQRWVALTTTLTKYEGAGLLALFDFAATPRVLDVGGNSGEMAAQICRVHPSVQATVFDLPVVCDIGAQHLAGRPEAARVRFAAGDARRDPLPANMDAVLFKSVLHDWPEGVALRLLEAGANALAPGGHLIVFERLPYDLESWREIPYHQLYNLVFLHFLRTPDVYAAALRGLGFEIFPPQQVVLDVPFFVLTARKPSA